MALNQTHIQYLKSRASRGDLDAQAILEGMLSEITLGEPKVVTILNAAAKNATVVAAAFRGDVAGANAPLVLAAGRVAVLAAAPRNLIATFGANWDGGKITVTGTDQFGKAQTEELASNTGSTTVGTKVWKTVTGATKETVGVDGGGGNTVTLGTGDKLACGTAKLTLPFCECRLDSGAATAVTVDQTLSAFTPTAVPDGSVDYTLLVYTEAIYND